MKNIHILPTDKQSKLYYWEGKLRLGDLTTAPKNLGISNQHIYITSDEEIKEGDYWLYICPINGLDYGDNNKPIVKNNLPNSWFEKLHDRLNYKKIILTTDQELIRDGVQAIDDEFLEWFVKNPSCESVETEIVEYGFDEVPICIYKISFPKEEPKQELEKEMFELEQELDIPSHLRWHNSKPKQETLEEAAENYTNEFYSIYAFKNLVKPISIDGAKWQQERMYSYEEVLEQLNLLYSMKNSLVDTFTDENDYITMKWFEQFKNK